MSDDLRSLRELIAALPVEQRAAFLAGLPVDVLAAATYEWAFWARTDQLEPSGPWLTWLMRSGRGAGKTRAGAEWVRAKAESGTYGLFNLVGRTDGDVRGTMVEGPSACSPSVRPTFGRSTARGCTSSKWRNGAKAFLFSAEEPDRLRGPQCEAAWCDELASWKYAEAYQNLCFGLRLGRDPRC